MKNFFARRKITTRLEGEFENGKPVSAVFLKEETEAVREKIRALMAKLKKKK